MGNNICCQDYRQDSNPIDKIEVNSTPHQNHIRQSHIKDSHIKHDHNHEHQALSEKSEEPQITIPLLYSTVEKTYVEKAFLKQHFESLHSKVKNYGSDIYEGSINEDNRPHGYGKMYKQNGSLFLGHFQNGKANGNGAYIFPDGSYYEGQFFHNDAKDTNGSYVSEHLTYHGGFEKNSFHGSGQEKGETHSFKGTYNHGKKVQGHLVWKVKDQKYEYDGHFNENEQFEGKGHLTEPKGSFTGNFLHGKKQGHGVYRSVNGLTYDGSYHKDKRNGFGTIFNEDGSIAYKGQIQDGMPHGKGETYNNGVATATTWVEGIDERVIL